MSHKRKNGRVLMSSTILRHVLLDFKGIWSILPNYLNNWIFCYQNSHSNVKAAMDNKITHRVIILKSI